MSQIAPSINGRTPTLLRNNSKTIRKNSEGFWEIITNNEALFLFMLLIFTILGGIILSALFQVGPSIRTNVLFNAAGAIGMAFLFIYIIFKFLGAKIQLLGVTIDVGLTIYILIVCFVIFVFGG